jgi:hypothetical protein
MFNIDRIKSLEHHLQLKYICGESCGYQHKPKYGNIFLFDRIERLESQIRFLEDRLDKMAIATAVPLETDYKMTNTLCPDGVYRLIDVKKES